MRRLVTILSIAVICGALASPTADARGRNNNNGGGGNNTHQSAPARGQHPNGNNSSGRPGGNVGTSTKPNNKPNNSGNSHGNNGAHGNNPAGPAHNNGGHGNNGAHGNNPAGPGHNNAMPNHGGNPGGPSYHNPGPGHNPGYGRPASVAAIPNHRPPRPLMMEHRPPYARPVPPPSFRPGPYYPSVRTILGITIGSAINYTINQLFNAGYYVAGYTNDAVYVNDVMQLNMLWPNATLYYNGGRLAGSEFVYSTPYYDTSRYYGAYNALTAAYGVPAVRNTLAGGMSCTWFGYDGNYVTLQFQPAMAYNGTSRYYTTLSFGI